MLHMYALHARNKKAAELHLANTLSRRYLTTVEETKSLMLRQNFEWGPDEHKAMKEVNHLLATMDIINTYRKERNQDKASQTQKKIVQSEWPDNKNSLPVRMSPYFQLRDELPVYYDFILRGDRLVIFCKALKKPLM